MLNIYNYDEPHRFLKDCWSEKNKKNPAFTLRSWARRLGFGSNNAALSLMLAGKRPIPGKYVPHFISDLELDEKEGFYLDTLISYKQAKGPEAKEFYWKKLQKAAGGRPLNSRQLDEFKTFQDPLHSLLCEMSRIRGFRSDAKWIKSRLRMNRSVSEIEEALQRLKSLGYLYEVDGQLKVSHEFLTSNNDLIDLAVQNYHKATSSLAAEQITEQGVSEREFQSFSFAIRPEKMPEAKQMIRDFLKEFLHRIESQPDEAEHVYQMNMQLFALTQNPKPLTQNQKQERENPT